MIKPPFFRFFVPSTGRGREPAHSLWQSRGSCNARTKETE
jgi:hypothetical protein